MDGLLEWQCCVYLQAPALKCKSPIFLHVHNSRQAFKIRRLTFLCRSFRLRLSYNFFHMRFLISEDC